MKNVKDIEFLVLEGPEFILVFLSQGESISISKQYLNLYCVHLFFLGVELNPTFLLLYDIPKFFPRLCMSRFG